MTTKTFKIKQAVQVRIDAPSLYVARLQVQLLGGHCITIANFSGDSEAEANAKAEKAIKALNDN